MHLREEEGASLGTAVVDEASWHMVAVDRVDRPGWGKAAAVADWEGSTVETIHRFYQLWEVGAWEDFVRWAGPEHWLDSYHTSLVVVASSLVVEPYRLGAMSNETEIVETKK